MFQSISILIPNMNSKCTIRHIHIDGLIGRLALLLRR